MKELLAQATKYNSRALLKTIFDSDQPESFVRTLPAQSLHMTVRTQGLGSCAELLELATLEQCRLLIDFDCWRRDEFDETRFWEWLEVTDATESLELLQKLFRVFDLKLIALLFARYMDARVFEQPTEAPPGPEFTTADKGRTWIAVNTGEPDNDFLLKRLIALIFESNPDLFYQMIAIPGVSTQTQLEEEAYQDKSRRLMSEGIPSAEYAAELHAPLPGNQLDLALKDETRHVTIDGIDPIAPLIYDSGIPEPLRSLLNAQIHNSEFAAELTLIMNAALVRFAVDFADLTKVQTLTEKVKGALNIGLEAAMMRSKLEGGQIFNRLGLQGIYRFGLTQLMALRSEAKKIPEQKALEHRAESALIHQGLIQVFPEMPTWYQNDQALEHLSGKLPAEFRAIEHPSEIEALRQEISKIGR